MALTRDEKQQILDGYAQRIGRAQVMIWARTKGLSTPQTMVLRQALRDAGAEGVVVKNSLMRISLERAGLPTDHGIMSGSSLVAFGYTDVAAASKAMTDFARLNEAVFQVVGGVAGGRLVNTEQVRALTTLPSREVLIALVLGGLNAPIGGFVSVLSGMMRGFMTVLKARGEQLEGTQSAG